MGLIQTAKGVDVLLVVSRYLHSCTGCPKVGTDLLPSLSFLVRMSLLKNTRFPLISNIIEKCRQIWVLGEYQGGRLVGKDSFGNGYYERNDQGAIHCISSLIRGTLLTIPLGRDRYVVYKNNNQDPTQIPSEWYKLTPGACCFLH